MCVTVVEPEPTLPHLAASPPSPAGPSWTSRTRLRLRPRTWRLWAEPLRVRWYVACVCVLPLVLLPLTVESLQARQVVLFACVALGSVITVEAMRRLSDLASGPVRDLAGAWLVPAVALLPAAWAMVAVLPMLVALQYRAVGAVVYRRVFSSAALALAAFAGALVARALLPAASAAEVLGPRGLAVVLLAAAVYQVVGALLVVVAVRLTAPRTRLREFLFDHENLLVDAADITTGVLTTVAAAAVSPVAVLAALPAVFLLQRSLMYTQLRDASRTDSRTGLLNPATWEAEADAVLGRLRPGHPAAVLLLDVDHFKAVNDTFGHAAGDQVLCRLAGVLQGATREGDLLGRLGGEEFAVLLPRAGLDEAVGTAERLRRALAEEQFSVDDRTFRVTGSIGVAVVDGAAVERARVVAAADRCMYAAKDAGRDRVHSVVLEASPVSGQPARDQAA